MSARLLIVEDHPLVAQGMRAMLEQHGYEVAEVVLDSERAVEAAERTRPDLVMLDLSMPGKNGIELLPQLRKVRPAMKVLVVTMHQDRTIANLALGKGANGFVPKESTPHELLEAIAAVLKGERYVSPRVPNRAYRGSGALGNPALDRLTPRQLQILKLMGEGKTGPEVAHALGLSPRTIEFHRARMRHALGVTTEAGLVQYAIALGLSGGPDADEGVPETA